MLEMVHMENQIHDLQRQVAQLKKEKRELQEQIQMEKAEMEQVEEAYVEYVKDLCRAEAAEVIDDVSPVGTRGFQETGDEEGLRGGADYLESGKPSE